MQGHVDQHGIVGTNLSSSAQGVLESMLSSRRKVGSEEEEQTDYSSSSSRPSEGKKRQGHVDQQGMIGTKSEQSRRDEEEEQTDYSSSSGPRRVKKKSAT